MRKVSKSFKSVYDKRVRLDPNDIEGATASVVLGLDTLIGDPEYWQPPMILDEQTSQGEEEGLAF